MIIDSVQTNNIKIDVGKVSLVLSLIGLLFSAGPRLVCVCVCVEMKQEVLDKQQQLEDCCKSLK